MNGNYGSMSLGEELRRLRGDLSLRALSEQVGLPNATISRYETGRRTPTSEQLAKILTALNVEAPERERLLALAQGPDELHAGVPGRRLEELIGYERGATRITQIEPVLIPGILQTHEYAQALLSEEPDVMRQVRLRLERTEILTRAEAPAELHAIVHEETLTRQIAPPAVMAQQMRHLLHMGVLPNVTIQVVPVGAFGPMPSLAGPFMILEFADAPPVVHLEHYRASMFLWEHHDVRSYVAAANRMTDKAMTPQQSAKIIAGLAKETP